MTISRSWMSGWRHPLRAGSLVVGLSAILALGCATSAQPSSEDRLSPAHLKNGPSLYETGRIAVVPPSSSGLRIEEGAIDRPSAAPPLPTPTAERVRGKHKVRARASQAR